MSTQINDGGSAFPEVFTDGYPDVYSAGGMTLRDYLAAKAMLGIISSGMMEAANQLGTDPVENEKAVAFSAYKMAEAMLAARKNP